MKEFLKMESLGKLEKLELRQYFKDEARDFTPWLAQQENLNILSEAIGIELEYKETEKSVSNFSIDILCKNIKIK